MPRVSQPFGGKARSPQGRPDVGRAVAATLDAVEEHRVGQRNPCRVDGEVRRDTEVHTHQDVLIFVARLQAPDDRP
ncbi:hypothetical protein GCM10009872_16400 [Actinopolymorpha rutila]